MDVCVRDIFEFKVNDGGGIDASGGGAWRREDLYRSERVGIELSCRVTAEYCGDMVMRRLCKMIAI